MSDPPLHDEKYLKRTVYGPYKTPNEYLNNPVSQSQKKTNNNNIKTDMENILKEIDSLEKENNSENEDEIKKLKTKYNNLYEAGRNYFLSNPKRNI